MVPCRMPVNYVVEMFLDRLAASKVYKGKDYTDASAWEYYSHGDISEFLHPRTKKLLELLLLMNAKKGEAYTFEFIRKKLLKKKKKQIKIELSISVDTEKKEDIPLISES